MFDIMELDDMIYLQLGRGDLARCALVDRKWHRSVVPYLWRDLAILENSRIGMEAAFHKLVVEDFLYERRQQRRQQGQLLDKNKQRVDEPTQPPSLTRHGHWIRKASEPKELLSCLLTQSEIHCRQTELPIEESDYPSPYELLRHFYKRCHNTQVDTMHLDPEDFTSDLWMIIANHSIPRVRHLTIEQSGIPNEIDSWKLMHILDRFSAALETLTLQADIKHSEHEDEDPERSWAQLKELTLATGYETINTVSFWKWLWTRCSHIERLGVYLVNEPMTESLVQAMLAHMPKLDTIRLKQDQGKPLGTEDDQMATFLSGSRKGWKSVNASRCMGFGRGSMTALIEHFSTLQELRINGCGNITGEQLVQVLSSCPNLHTLVAIDDGAYADNILFTTIKVEAFTDRSLDTGMLRTWLCEKSLKILKIRVGGIPEIDRDTGINTERYPGQRQEIQSLMYERLGRLTNLETLWLGHDPMFDFRESWYYFQIFQSDCLKVSLECGLEKLSGLKRMKELGVSCMDHSARLEDVQWMLDHWPKLRACRGLNHVCRKLLHNRIADDA
ncbi:hypothetical protein B0O80DRAFT_497541 [Mortierella sp. GBAus27b]|nr:hypothetical protein BGX31_006197 [Mortierella sp. GBA43]KAI8356014.1 hypothetical protein B0O80DRAFT_497541 [Mortierella sp. GBAus27b]